MAASPKSMVLDALPAARLRELADHFEVSCPRQSKAELVDAFTRYRRLSAERILEQLTVDELKACCAHAGVTASGQRKQDLIDALCANPTRPSRTLNTSPSPVAPQRSQPPMTTQTPDQVEAEFLDNLDKRLWTAADKLRGVLDAALYKHAVLGLIFLKYVSDSFAAHRQTLEAQFRDPKHDYYCDDSADIAAELEERDYYTEANVFWVPPLARWQTLKENAKIPSGTELTIPGRDEPYKIGSVGRLIDDCLSEVERDNPKLKGVLNKRYAQLPIDQAKLGELIDLISTIPFSHATLQAKDILGHVYEYFLGQFALAEGKKGGQFYTPKAIVGLIVEILEPFKGRVYDPAMGSGGFFVMSDRFIQAHKGSINACSIYGQEYNHTTWQLAAMNMAIRGLDFDFGKEPANTFTNDQHPDLRADVVMANPPFNMKEWDAGVKDDDPRWAIEDPKTKQVTKLRPPSGNANFAWLLHMLYHCGPNGSVGLLLANGSMSSNTNTEGDIRRKLVEADLVECVIALPGQLFTNTQIPACIWFLTKNKGPRITLMGRKLADRRGKTLFINGRSLGYMKDRVLRDFRPKDIRLVADTVHHWQESADAYADVPGFCASVGLDGITKHDFVLTPGRYVGATEQENDDEPFAERMKRLCGDLKVGFAKSRKLEEQIRENLAGMGYEC